jgi:hypothetical protein
VPFAALGALTGCSGHTPGGVAAGLVRHRYEDSRVGEVCVGIELKASRDGPDHWPRVGHLDYIVEVFQVAGVTHGPVEVVRDEPLNLPGFQVFQQPPELGPDDAHSLFAVGQRDLPALEG